MGFKAFVDLLTCERFVHSFHLHQKLVSQRLPVLSQMADSDRVVYPDEVEEVKEEVMQEKTVEKSETVPEPPVAPGIQMRNMISVPSNCPPGYKMGADGVCREVFN
ncbi:hypothetical protein RR46_15120 [Papilio xuthus]|uniref:Uncharacterized protein n=1 Tax=Papilio xuthus TaxID=66420 RepID=A0A194PE44_PAPXU|nr:hypothetical protein RR46_15120 [Papilio xuthus]